jgi:PHS family inorganic phosphate transporter-like MFS transporter
LNGFNWRVWAVAASGFFTDSYNLFGTVAIQRLINANLTRFSTNVILPSLAFVFWQKDQRTWREDLINTLTLLGATVGMIFLGYLADRFGRTRLYGIELVIVIFSTIGIASSNTGVGSDMAVLGWLCAWRFVMGIGIGWSPLLHVLPDQSNAFKVPNTR